MLKLKGDKVNLRALEAEDLQFLYELENNPEIWEISGTLTPYSKHILKKYLENDIIEVYEIVQVKRKLETT